MIRPILLDGTTQLDREEVGGKAWSVNELARRRLPVPPAFALSTQAGRIAASTDRLPPQIADALEDGISFIERALDRRFGNGPRPLLVSVRSGAATSMPGMMDTVLNVGATPRTLAALAMEFSRQFSDDVGRRLRTQFESIVGISVPESARQQLHTAVDAVFRSWNSPRAVAYRNHHGIDHTGATAVTIQAMVFGNRGPTSGTGVLFSRNPRSGESLPLGEWLPGGQGEDVVSGRVIPLPLADLGIEQPQVYHELLAVAALLERELQDVQDIEFTVEDGRLWILQTRSAKRSPVAAARIAVSMVHDKIITPATALDRLDSNDIQALIAPRIDPGAAEHAVLVASGLPACPGVVTGTVVLSAAEAEDRAASGDSVILGRPTTDPGDLLGMVAADGILTEIGGVTSHAAVVSRELGKACIVGCGQGALASLEGEIVTIDGSSGEVFAGILPLSDGAASATELEIIARWLIDDPRPTLVRALDHCRGTEA